MRNALLFAFVAIWSAPACTRDKPAAIEVTQVDPGSNQSLCQVGTCCHCPAGTACVDGACEPISRGCSPACPRSTTCRGFACDTTSGSCEETDAPAGTSCSDGNLCTFNDHCDGLGNCVGTTVTCGSSNPCISVTCNGTSSCTVGPNTGGACGDGNACTYGDVCNASEVCSGTPVTCNSNMCQTSSCNGTSSCSVTTMSGCACQLAYNRFLSETGSAITDAADYAFWQAGSWFNHPFNSDVFAVKTANTASGNVEVDVLDGAHNFVFLQYGPAGGTLSTAHFVTPIPVASAADYRWAIVNFVTGTASTANKSLVAIRVQNTASGKVEVSVLDGNQKMAVYSLQNSVTPIPTSDVPNLRFATGDNGVTSGPPAHIYVVRVAGSASGKVELSTLDRNTNYTTLTAPIATAIPISDAPFFAGWAIADYVNCSGVEDGIFDLYGFKTQNTAGNVEVHVLDGTNLTRYLHLTTSAITVQDAPNFVWSAADFDTVVPPEVYAIKLRNTGTGQAEMHILSGAP